MKPTKDANREGNIVSTYFAEILLIPSFLTILFVLKKLQICREVIYLLQII